jgi:hypothetical protein
MDCHMPAHLQQTIIRADQRHPGGDGKRGGLADRLDLAQHELFRVRRTAEDVLRNERSAM